MSSSIIGDVVKHSASPSAGLVAGFLGSKIFAMDSHVVLTYVQPFSYVVCLTSVLYTFLFRYLPLPNSTISLASALCGGIFASLIANFSDANEFTALLAQGVFIGSLMATGQSSLTITALLTLSNIMLMYRNNEFDDDARRAMQTIIYSGAIMTGTLVGFTVGTRIGLKANNIQTLSAATTMMLCITGANTLTTSGASLLVLGAFLMMRSFVSK